MCLAIPAGWHSRNAARLGTASSLPMLQLHLMHQQCHDLEWGMVCDSMTLWPYCIATNIQNKLAWWCCFHIQLTTQTTKVHLLHSPAKPGSWERLGGLNLLHSLHTSRLAAGAWSLNFCISFSVFISFLSVESWSALLKCYLVPCSTQKAITWQVSACRSLDEHSSKCETNTSKE